MTHLPYKLPITDTGYDPPKSSKLKIQSRLLLVLYYCTYADDSSGVGLGRIASKSPFATRGPQELLSMLKAPE